MIEIKGLCHSLEKQPVLKDIDLTVDDGTILGIVGVNGAGKSTLLRLMAGVYIADVGSILFDGASPTEARTRENIFFLPDDPYDNAQATPLSLFNYYRQVLYPNMEKDYYLSLLSKYQIEPNKAIRVFSKGMRRQVFIALALASKARYLLLDEAFDGLDPLARKQFKEEIIAHVEENNTTVLITSHSLNDVENFCDRFILLDGHTVQYRGDIASHVSRLCKFELAFKEPVEPLLFLGFPTLSLEMRGKFVTLILEGDRHAMKEKLLTLSPAVIEEFPIDFEETFLCDLKKKRGENA